jgi:hypothetical protein
MTLVDVTFALGGEQTVNRLGFGAMRLPEDRGTARALLRRAVELGADPLAMGGLEAGSCREVISWVGRDRFDRPVAVAS